MKQIHCFILGIPKAMACGKHVDLETQQGFIHEAKAYASYKGWQATSHSIKYKYHPGNIHFGTKSNRHH